MPELIINSKKLFTERPAFVMGIVNATPDSFYEDSRGGFELAMKQIEAGADIIDIGGESTRPGYSYVNEDEELKRVLPLIKQIRKENTDVLISVDTQKTNVIKSCIEEGADILNDVSAMQNNPSMAGLVAESGISVILMHRFLENEKTRKTNPKIIKEVSDYLTKRIKFAKQNGVKDSQIFVDPGIGFGKTFKENISLIKCADELCRGKYPVVMALSRKRCIGTMTDCTDVKDRLAGTLSANLFSVISGAKIVRVHDVKETVDSLKVMKYLF